MSENLQQDHEFRENSVMNRLVKLKLSLWIFVIIPTAMAVVYYGVLASDIYTSESYFVVKSPARERTATGFAAFFTGQMSNSASDEVHAVEAYINSRDALRDLNRKGLVTAAYTRPSISIFDRFGGGGDQTDEDLYKYFKKRVEASFDTAASVTKLKVQAYTPQDAYVMNKKLLEQGEALVNRLNQRSRGDLIRYAENEVAEAKARASTAAVALSNYRNQHGVVDPEKQATVQVQLISKLQDELIANQTQLDQLRRFTPDNPQVSVLSERVESIQRQMNTESGKIVGNSRSLAGAAAGYQRVSLDNDFAAKQLASAMASLQDAKNEARRQQVYVERIVQPSKPDGALEPKRLKGIAAAFFLGLILYGIWGLVMAAVREHRQ